MLKNMTGSIFNSKAEALVSPVNCVGVMGKGLALDFKKRYPESFRYYKSVCDGNMAVVGRIFPNDEHGVTIIHFPTKVHWRNESKPEWIELGLKDLRVFLEAYHYKSVAIPLLGCGLGGLDEKEVLPLIENFANKVPHIEVELWRYDG